jgi:transcriptional regulator with XRE-family HTH domain
METNLSIIAKVIAAKYKTSNISKRDISLKTGLSQNTIGNALRGKNLTLNTVFKIMEVFGMNLEDVVNEGKAMGFTFPKVTNAVVPTVNSTKIAELLAKEETTLQITSKLGMTESDLLNVIGTKPSTVKQEVIEMT